MVKDKARHQQKAGWTVLFLPLAFNHLPLAVLPKLFSQSQTLNNHPVALQILFLQIVKKPSPLTDEL